MSSCNSHNECSTGYCLNNKCATPGPYNPCKPGNCPTDYICSEGWEEHMICKAKWDKSKPPSYYKSFEFIFLAYILPIIALIVIISLIVYCVRRSRRNKAPVAIAAPAPAVHHPQYAYPNPPQYSYTSSPQYGYSPSYGEKR